jgi:hypothetical protein
MLSIGPLDAALAYIARIRKYGRSYSPAAILVLSPRRLKQVVSRQPPYTSR